MTSTGTIAKHVLLALLLCAAAMTGHAAPLSLCYEDEDAQPWYFKQGKGLNIVLVEMVAAKSAVELKVHRAPWKRCLLEVENGQVDGAIAASYNEERASYSVYPTVLGKLDPSRRIHSDSYSIYRAIGDPVDWNGRHFSGLNGMVGLPSGYSVGNDLKKLGVKIDDASKNTDNNMHKLVAGRVQAVAALTREADHLLKANADLSAKIEKISIPLIDKPYFVIFGKAFYAGNTKLVEDFWTMIETVRKSAEYSAMESATLKQKLRPEPK